MNDIQAWLDQGKTLAGQATEGPWEVGGGAHPGPDDDLTLYQQGEGGAIAYIQPSWGDAEFIADARTRLPQALAALQAVLDLHCQGKFYGEPGDPGCDHNGDYDGPDHFWDEDYGVLCESTAIYPDDPFCAGCPRDEEFKLQPWPCPTARAIQNAIKEQPC